VLEVVYVDVLEKKLVEVAPKGAFAPLFGSEETLSGTGVGCYRR